MTGDAGSNWFSGDLISNTAAADTAWLPRMVFGLLGGGAGYRFNPVPAMLYLSDKKAFKASVRASFEAHPAHVVLPAHGAPLRENVQQQTLDILA